jgi:hypothetical protein
LEPLSLTIGDYREPKHNAQSIKSHLGFRNGYFAAGFFRTTFLSAAKNSALVGSTSFTGFVSFLLAIRL